MANAIRIEGLAALQRANAMVQAEIDNRLKDALKDAAQPVAIDAQSLAVQQITRITLPWSQMRIGVTRRAVYVAPKQRSRDRNQLRRRPNLGRLLIDRAMTPALAQNESQIQDKVNRMLSDLFDRWARLG